MKELNKKIDPVQQLLREAALEELLKNETLLNMNAAIVFNTKESTTLIPAKEREFLQALGAGTNKLRGLLLAVVIVAIALMISLILYRTFGEGKIVVDTFEPIAADRNTSPASKEPSGNGYGATALTSRDSSIKEKASVQRKDTAKQLGPGVIQEERLIASNPAVDPERAASKFDDLYPATDPVFNTVATPNDYRKTVREVPLDSLIRDFRLGQKSISIPVYEGKPFSKGFADAVYINFGEYISGKNAGKFAFPFSLLRKTDAADISLDTTTRAGSVKHILSVKKLSAAGLEKMSSPFYFRKTEVTNKEYKEFVNWVRASNGFGSTPIITANIDTILVTDGSGWGQMITKKGKRYRIVTTTRPLEDFDKVFAYRISDEQRIPMQFRGLKINVLPDTLTWVTDFRYSYNQPMADLYFAHPAYDDYPVVGVSYFQALAFLDWKTQMHQKQLDKEAVPYRISYSLPSEVQWEIVSMLEQQDGKLVYKPVHRLPENWLCNLSASNNEPAQFKRYSYLKNLFTQDQYHQGNYIADSYFHTGPTDLTKISIAKLPGSFHLGPVDISWLDGNVSEWMAENYLQDWKPYFELHMQELEKNGTEEDLLAKTILEFFNRGNAENGFLAMGANWYDERTGKKPGSNKNDAGMNVRRYFAPDQQHSTIGFRYVVTVTLNDEIGAAAGAE